VSIYWVYGPTPTLNKRPVGIWVAGTTEDFHSHCHLMAESAAAPREVVASTGKEVAKVEEYIPEVIEERRRDSEGRVLAFRYARGKLLGKVSD